MIDLFEMDQWIMFCYFRQLDFEVSKNSLVEYLPPIFCNNDYMIVAAIYTMLEMYQLHTFYYTAPKKNAGGTPSLDLTVGDLSMESLKFDSVCLFLIVLNEAAYIYSLIG